MKYRALYLNLPQRISDLQKQFGTKLDSSWLNAFIFILSGLQEMEVRLIKEIAASQNVFKLAETAFSDTLIVKILNNDLSTKYIRQIKMKLAETKEKSAGEVLRFFTETAQRLKASSGEESFIRLNTMIFQSQPVIMGILNVTPDSFSDGGKYGAMEKAVWHALEMEQAGAQIIDIGGESSRPGAEPVPLDEEIRRTIPVIRELRRHSQIPLSIDTYKSEVARLALEAGAGIVNDISGLRKDPLMADVVKDADCPVIIMHMKGEPQNMQKNPYYDDVVDDVYRFFEERIHTLGDSGIDKIILDPGIGFGKRLQDNLKLIRDLRDFKYFGKPILAGVSRKSFIGQVLDKEVSERLVGTVVANTFAAMHGANILRVHDVAEMQQVKKMINAVFSVQKEN